MASILVPIAVCVVLPVAITLIVFWASINSNNKRAAVLIKAIGANNSIDTDKLAAALAKPKRTARELLNLRLLRACIFSLIGVVLMVVGIISWAGGVDFADDNVAVPMMLGGVSLAVGVSYLIVYFVSRRQPED